MVAKLTAIQHQCEYCRTVNYHVDYDTAFDQDQPTFVARCCACGAPLPVIVEEEEAALPEAITQALKNSMFLSTKVYYTSSKEESG